MIEIRTTVAWIGEKTRTARARVNPENKDETIWDVESLGWYVLLEGSTISVCIGDQDYGVKAGDPVVVRIGK